MLPLETRPNIAKRLCIKLFSETMLGLDFFRSTYLHRKIRLILLVGYRLCKSGRAERVSFDVVNNLRKLSHVRKISEGALYFAEGALCFSEEAPYSAEEALERKSML